MSLYPSPQRAYLSGIPSGLAGVKATLKAMAAIVNAYKTDSGIHQLCRQITAGLPPQNLTGAPMLYVTALQHFVRDRIRWVADVEGVETLQSPVYTLQIAAGDCDDKTILLCALLASCGFVPVMFAIGESGGPFTHVLAGVRMGTKQIPLETIVPAGAMGPGSGEPGWMPPKANPIMLWNI